MEIAHVQYIGMIQFIKSTTQDKRHLVIT